MAAVQTVTPRPDALQRYSVRTGKPVVNTPKKVTVTVTKHAPGKKVPEVVLESDSDSDDEQLMAITRGRYRRKMRTLRQRRVSFSTRAVRESRGIHDGVLSLGKKEEQTKMKSAAHKAYLIKVAEDERKDTTRFYTCVSEHHCAGPCAKTRRADRVLCSEETCGQLAVRFNTCQPCAAHAVCGECHDAFCSPHLQWHKSRHQCGMTHGRGSVRCEARVCESAVCFACNRHVCMEHCMACGVTDDVTKELCGNRICLECYQSNEASDCNTCGTVACCECTNKHLVERKDGRVRQRCPNCKTNRTALLSPTRSVALAASPLKSKMKRQTTSSTKKRRHPAVDPAMRRLAQNMQICRHGSGSGSGSGSPAAGSPLKRRRS